MVVRKTRALGIIQYWSCRVFFNNLVFLSFHEILSNSGLSHISTSSAEISLLLLPEEVYPELLHQWYEHVCDILEYFRSFHERIKQLALTVEDL